MSSAELLDHRASLLAALKERAGPALDLLPGLLLAGVVAAAARFGADHLGGPPMIYALTLGLLLGFLASEPTCRTGLDFASRSVMRLGIALLGLQVSVATLISLGPLALLMIVAIVTISVSMGILIGRLLGFETQLAIIAACATSICGATAAMAVAATLPRGPALHPVKCMIIATIALFSTTAMLSLPALLHALGFDVRQIGFVIGASIHDVAQVVSAGYSVSDEAGQMATIVKLVRVSCLLPIVALIGFRFRNAHDPAADADRPPLLPFFMVAFAGLMLLNSIEPLPRVLVQGSADISRWCLVIAIAALGVQTSMRQMAAAGGRLILLLLIQSCMLFGLALGAAIILGRQG